MYLFKFAFLTLLNCMLPTSSSAFNVRLVMNEIRQRLVIGDKNDFQNRTVFELTEFGIPGFLVLGGRPGEKFKLITSLCIQSVETWDRD